MRMRPCHIMEMLLIIELHTGAATTSYAGLGETYVAYILLSIHTMHLLRTRPLDP